MFHSDSLPSLTEFLDNGPGKDEAARKLKMVGRTWRRRLANKDASYQQSLRDVCGQIAIAYLRDIQMTVAEIAGRGGFADSANFRHGFKRWTGHPPNHFRRPLSC
ncbi:MAG: helix-turn-helix domain-containing protein [Gammaproteobacteria bacterium]